MKIRPTILAPHWAAAAIEEIAAEYEENGYAVERSVTVGNAQADLVARRDAETLVLEVKAARWSDEDATTAEELRRAARTAGWQYKLVVALPPHTISVEIDRLEEIVRELLEARLHTTDIVNIARSINLESVVAVGLDSVRLGAEGIELRGDGEAEFELVYGSGGGDQGMTMTDVYPFEFHVRLNPDLSIADVLELTVDTSAFYGPG